MIYEAMLICVMLYALAMIAATSYQIALSFKQWRKRASRRKLIAKLRRSL